MIFYFTGTGNSLYVAKQLDSNPISIPQATKSGDLCFSADTIGVVCPIYGHEMPAMVKQFFEKSTLDTDYLFVILTYGCRHGNAVELAEKYLAKVGKSAAYIKTMIMVDNFLPVFDMDEERSINKNIEEQLASIKADIEAKKHKIEKVSFKDRFVHKMYVKMVKHQPETVWADFSVSNKCIGCGICVKVCPSGDIKIENLKAVHERKNCQACYACIHACPELAITLKKDKNPSVRYRNPEVTLDEIIASNNQNKND